MHCRYWNKIWFIEITIVCAHCQAKKFVHETKGFCCSGGQISLITNDVAQKLYDLYTSENDQSFDFQKHIRFYNNSFAFTSFGIKTDKDFCKNKTRVFIHFEFKDRFFISLMNYYLKTTILDIYSFTFMILSMKCKID